MKFRVYDTEKNEYIYYSHCTGTPDGKNGTHQHIVIGLDGKPLLLIENNIEDWAKVRTFLPDQMKVEMITEDLE